MKDKKSIHIVEMRFNIIKNRWDMHIAGRKAGSFVVDIPDCPRTAEYFPEIKPGEADQYLMEITKLKKK